MFFYLKQNSIMKVAFKILLVTIISLIIGLDLNAQLPTTDSLIYSKYWNKILPYSVHSKGDFLYAGIDNNIQLIYPDAFSQNFKIILSTQNGFLAKDSNAFLTIPSHAGHSFFSISIVSKENDTILIGKKQFIVKNVPYPILQIKNIIIDDQKTISRNAFCCGDSLQLYFTEDLPNSKSWYHIESFTINYFYGGVTMSVMNEGPILNKTSIELLNKFAPGKEIALKVLTVTPTNILRYLPLVRFKIL